MMPAKMTAVVPDDGAAVITGYEYPKKKDVPNKIKITYGGQQNIKIPETRWGGFAEQIKAAGNRSGREAQIGIRLSVSRSQPAGDEKPTYTVTGILG